MPSNPKVKVKPVKRTIEHVLITDRHCAEVEDDIKERAYKLVREKRWEWCGMFRVDYDSLEWLIRNTLRQALDYDRHHRRLIVKSVVVKPKPTKRKGGK
jgi:hypothetical protein